MQATEKTISRWWWLGLAAGTVLIYWLSIGPFFLWEQSALTRTQYLARKKMERRIYAPVIWLEKVDGTHTVFRLNYLNINMWVKGPPFKSDKLPAE